MRMYLRQGNIVFSRQFVDTLKQNDIILTRKNHFKRNCIIINHGNTTPLTISKKADKVYLLNKPDAIHWCSNKLHNYEILKEYYPETTTNQSDVQHYPVIAKPLHGHHGYGIKRFNYMRDLKNFLNKVKEKYIIQTFIPIKHEFRFNVINREVFQVSHKQRVYDNNGNPLKTDNGGMVFSYRSLGSNAKISSKFWKYINGVIEKFHNTVGYDLADYCIDVIKGEDGKYYLSEMNSAYGIGQYTLEKLIDRIDALYENNHLENYKVR